MAWNHGRNRSKQDARDRVGAARIGFLYKPRRPCLVELRRLLCEWIGKIDEELAKTRVGR
jgi:hypothetical protein